MLICGATNISLLNSMGQHFHSLLSNKRVLNKEDKNLLTKDFSIPVNICYHLFFSLLRFPQSSSALPCPHTDSHIPHSPEQAGQDPRLRFSLCCLLRTWLQWKSGEVRLQKAIEPLPLSRWLHPCGNLWSGDQQTHAPIFCIPGYRFQRGGGTWATKQKWLFTSTSVHPPQRQATPSPPVTPQWLTPLPLPLEGDKQTEQPRHTKLFCFEHYMHSCPKKWASSRLTWTAFAASQTLYLCDDQAGLELVLLPRTGTISLLLPPPSLVLVLPGSYLCTKIPGLCGVGS